MNAIVEAEEYLEEVELEPIDERAFHTTRERVDELIAHGWTIVGRNPVVMTRGRGRLEIKPNGSIVYD